MQSGDTARFMLSKKAGGPTILTKTLSGGSFQLDPADTTGLDFGDYFFDVQLTYADGTSEIYLLLDLPDYSLS